MHVRLRIFWMQRAMHDWCGTAPPNGVPHNREGLRLKIQLTHVNDTLHSSLKMLDIPVHPPITCSHCQLSSSQHTAHSQWQPYPRVPPIPPTCLHLRPNITIDPNPQARYNVTRPRLSSTRPLMGAIAMGKQDTDRSELSSSRGRMTICSAKRQRCAYKTLVHMAYRLTAGN